MKKKALLVLSGLAVLLVGGGFAGHGWVMSHLQKESLVAKMERAWNLRAQLDETSVSLFSRPATVKLTGLKMAPRDEEVVKPLAERAALAPDAALVTANEVVLSVELADLLSGTLNVDKLNIDGLSIRNVVDNGTGPLSMMFRSPNAPADPAVVAPAPAPAPAPETVSGAGGNPGPDEKVEAAAATPESPVVKKPKVAHSPMKAEELRVNLAAKSVGVTNARYEYTDLSGRTKATVERLQFTLTDIDVVPGDLAKHNLAKFSLSASVRHEKTDEKLTMADCILEGSGTVEPFDPKTGDLNPDTDLTLKILKGGLLGGIPLESQLGKKDLEDLAKKGIHLGDIALGGVLSQDAVTRLHALPSGKMIVKQKTLFAFPQYEITVDEQSWLSPAQDMHSVKAKLVVSTELSERILADAKKTIEAEQDPDSKSALEAIKAAAQVLLTDLLSAGLMDEQNRLVLPYVSKGKLSKPKVDITAMAAEASEKVLKNPGDFLNKVLDRLFPVSEEDKKKEEQAKQGQEAPKVEPPKVEEAPKQDPPGN